MVREPQERKAAGLISQLQALRNQRAVKRQAAQAVRREVSSLVLVKVFQGSTEASVLASMQG